VVVAQREERRDAQVDRLARQRIATACRPGTRKTRRSNRTASIW
jgi:hypothetical protein